MFAPMSYFFNSSSLTKCKEIKDADATSSFIFENIGYSISYNIIIILDFFLLWLGWFVFASLCWYWTIILTTVYVNDSDLSETT